MYISFILLEITTDTSLEVTFLLHFSSPRPVLAFDEKRDGLSHLVDNPTHITHHILLLKAQSILPDQRAH